MLDNKFDTVSSNIAYLNLNNIDTDMIIPKQFLKTIKRTGLGQYLFYDLRYNSDGVEINDFILNNPDYQGVKILLANKNFGCGSSREHAPWSIADFGIKIVIAESFADIFYNNCFKNSILPITLPQNTINDLALYSANSKNKIKVDLINKLITKESTNEVYPFVLEESKQMYLLKGLNDITETLEHDELITAFETKQKILQPWLYINE